MIRLRNHFLEEILAQSASCVKELESHIRSSMYCSIQGLLTAR